MVGCNIENGNRFPRFTSSSLLSSLELGQCTLSCFFRGDCTFVSSLLKCLLHVVYQSVRLIFFLPLTQHLFLDKFILFYEKLFVNLNVVRLIWSQLLNSSIRKMRRLWMIVLLKISGDGHGWKRLVPMMLSIVFGAKRSKNQDIVFVYCVTKKLNYGSNGKKALLKHNNDAVHQKWVRSQQHAVTLPGTAPVQAKLSLPDRVAHQKAVITAFLCENTLPFSLAPKLIELTKNLSSDK